MTMRATAGSRVCVSLLLLLGVGCAGAPPPPPPPPVTPAPVAEAPAPPPAPALDPRVKRQLVKDLLRDVADYYELLRYKDVERASQYVDAAGRRAYADGLWELVAAYEVQGADVQSYELYPQPDGVLAKVKVVRTLFAKRSVVPERSEVWMTWVHQGARWVLRPQERK